MNPYKIEEFPDHIKYVIRTNENENKLSELLGDSILSKMKSYYIEINLEEKEWYPSFDHCWLYRNQPPLTPIEDIEKLLKN